MSQTARRTTLRPDASDSPTRDRALAAALDLFDIQGTSATTIEQVRDASGVSIGSLYHHFGSREGLIAALYEDLLERYRAVLVAELARHSGARALLDAVIATHIGWSVANRAAARFLARHRRDPALQRADARLKAGTSDFVSSLLLRLKPAIASGEIRDLPAELLVSVVVGPMQVWLQQWFDGQTRQKPEAAIRQLADLAWAALAIPRKPRGAAHT